MKLDGLRLTVTKDGSAEVTFGLLPSEVPYFVVLNRIALALEGLEAFDEPPAAPGERDTHEITGLKPWWPDQTDAPEDRAGETEPVVGTPAPEPLAELAGSARRGSAEIDNRRDPRHDVVVFAETPAPTTRRSRAAAPAPEQLDPPAEEPAAPAPTARRSRAAAPAATPEISDLELTKAASEAAEKLGVETVKQIITGFNVAAVNQLAKPPSPQREEFIKKLAEAINADA